MRQEAWFPYLPDLSAADALAVCFPFAGGGAAFYQPWMAPARAKGLALLPVELPGRGMRRNEPAFRDARELVQALAPALRPWLDRPFLLFGHSLGALLAFETVLHCQRRYALSATALVVSGRHPPHLARDEATFRHNLPLPRLARALSDLNGTAPEVLAHEELLDLLAPTLRADFAMTELYRFEPGEVADCPLTALTGTEDAEVSVEEMAAWCDHGTGPFRLLTLPGDHFYLRPQAETVLRHLHEAAQCRVPAA